MSEFNQLGPGAEVNVEFFPQSPVSSVFGRVGIIQADPSDYELYYAPLSTEVPAGGAIGYVLTKNSAADYDMAWKPGGGAGGGAVNSIFGRTGDVVAQAGDYSAYYAPLGSQPPVGGTTGQVLTKNSNADYDYIWHTAPTAPVTTVFTRTGDIVALSGDYASFYAPLGTQLPSGGTTGQVLAKNSNSNFDAHWINPPAGGVTSVFTRTGDVVATTGDYSISQITGANPTNWDAAFAQRNQWDGGPTSLVAATGRTSLGASTVGGNLFTAANPGAISFIRINADNSVTLEGAAPFRSDLGATTVGTNLFTLANPGSISFLKINADNSISAESAGTHRGSLGATTVGSNFFTLTNPSAITFPRINADNTVSARTASQFLSDIGGLGNIPMGNILLVDTTFGFDGTGQRNSYSFQFKTIGAAVTAALSGDIIYVNPGTYDQGTTPLVIKAGVTVVGADTGNTIITGLVNGLARCVVELGNNAAIASFTVNNTGTGAAIGYGTGSTAASGSSASNCFLQAPYAVYINKAAVTNFSIYSSSLVATVECIHVEGTTGNFTFDENDAFDTVGTAAVNAINCLSGTSIFSNGTLTISGAGAATVAVSATGASTRIELDGVETYIDTSGGAKDIVVASGAIVAVNNIHRTDGAVLSVTGSLTELSRYALAGPSVISDAAYGPAWLGTTNVGPSKNTLYNYIHSFDTDDDGKVNVLDCAAGIVNTNSSGVIQAPLTPPGSAFVGVSDTQTLTNKFITPQVQSVVDAGGTFVPVSILNDVVIMTGLTQPTTIAAPTGAAVQAERLLFRIRDNGTARALTWNAIYRPTTNAPLLNQTIVGKTTYLLFFRNVDEATWDCVANSDAVVAGGGGGGGAPASASYITAVAESGLSNEFALASLGTGILKNTTGTGIPTIAVAGTDYQGASAQLTSLAAITYAGNAGQFVRVNLAATGFDTARVGVLNTGAGIVNVDSSGNIQSSLTIPAGQLVGTSATQTLTNKFITPQLQSVGDAGGTFTPVAITNDMGIMTALTQATTIAAPTGTPVTGERLIIRLKDNGTPRALTWDAIYRASTANPLPSTTTANAVMYTLFIYHGNDNKWDLLSCSANAFEPALGNPSANGYLLSSTTAGVRSWVAPGGGGLTMGQAVAVSMMITGV